MEHGNIGKCIIFGIALINTLMSLRSNKLSQQLYLIVNMNSTAATPPPILSTTQAATSLSRAYNTMMFPS